MRNWLFISKRFRVPFVVCFAIVYSLGFGQVDSIGDGEHRVGLSDVSVSGNANFVTFYRSMAVRYPGSAGGENDLSFTPYAVSNEFSGNFSQQPFLTINVSAQPTSRTSFSVDYALSHLFTGSNFDSSKTLTVQNLFEFYGGIETKHGVFNLRAGGGAMEYSLSPLTIYNKEFREPAFERLPWEWRMNSYEVYEDAYENTTALAPSSVYNTATQGFILEAMDLPGSFGVTAIYGRSNSTLLPDRALADHPLQLAAGRIYKVLSSTEKIGINYYHQFGYTDGVNRTFDNRQVATLDFLLSSKKVDFSGEIGVGTLDNPESDNSIGEAVSLSLRLLNAKVSMPLKLQVYRIDKNVAALESAVLNSNASVQQGGYGSNRDYENSLYPAYLAEIEMMSNNRQGLIFNIDKVFEVFKIEFGYAVSEELEKVEDRVSIQQMVNSFSRSRFNPWIMGTGPYGRVSNRFRRSFETISIVDPYDEKKTFQAIDLSFKVRFQLFSRELILMNFTYRGVVGVDISPFSDRRYLTTTYEEFSAYYKLMKRFNLLGFYSSQWTKGGERTELSVSNNKPIDQYGYGIGFGLNYDFTPTAGLYLRHKWMKHTDPNFVEDQFKGTETTVELKYFF